jgi:8-oxo-dGTP pyrophosphatase MutT (NUDIX family)
VSAHSEARHSLTGWSPPTPALGALRDRFVDFLRDHPDALERSCSPGHLTAGALVLSSDLTAVLLNLHGKARRWLHFGGHWEPGDQTLLATAAREAAEESGLGGLVIHPEPVHLDVHTVEFCRGHGRTDHLDVRYAALATSDAQATASDESLDVRWWPVDDLPELGPEMHELIALAQARLAQSAGASTASRRAPAE